MIWVALGHFYMYGVFLAAAGDTEPIRNRGDGEKVNNINCDLKRRLLNFNTLLNTPT